MKEIIDTVGRILTVQTNLVGRITEIALNSLSKYQRLVQYRYNDEQDLVEIIDAMGQSATLKYRNHLMIQKTDRNNHSFYFQYDASQTGARVTKTWGDGNLLSGTLHYHDDRKYTEVIDLGGSKTQYHYDKRMICTKVIYPDGSLQRDFYDEHLQLVRTIDEENRITSYVYNEWSLPEVLIRPDGGKIKFEYDKKGRMIASTNPEGNKQHWIYNEDGTLQKSIDESDAETTYAYNDEKLITSVTNARGDTIELAYDEQLNLNQVTLPDGTTSKWEYDERGNCLSTTNPLGAVQKFSYDALNRLVRSQNPDGNDVRLSYNGYDDITHIKDNQTEAFMTYDALGNVTSKKQKDRKTAYKYNNDGHLVAVICKKAGLTTSEKSEVYTWERDFKGNIIKEVGFDGLTRTYKRDLSGLVKRVDRPEKRWTTYEYNQLGNVVSAKYYDNSYDEFKWDKVGQLVEAKNDHTVLKFERDKAGRIVKEMQDDHVVESRYDVLGNRILVESSLGAKIAFDHNAMGQISHIASAQAGQDAWVATMSYNALGQEELRKVSGGVISESCYDVMGRVVNHRVGSNGRDTRRRKYDWGVNQRLRSITNELSGTKTTFKYDEFANLVQADYGFQNILSRESDEFGNLYAKGDKSDRIYDKGSRLKTSGVNTNELKNQFQGGFGKLVTRGTEYKYDGEGNLTKKVEPNGNTTKYEYYGNGMLKEVKKPDGEVISFKYDSLGRRIEKSSDSKIVKFVWDGNNPLHEWAELPEEIDQYVKTPKHDLTTWVFEDGFTPSAKLTNQGNYSIISDYLGTPVEAYDSNGNKVWEVELDIYGRVKPRPVKREWGQVVDDGLFDKDFIPFRYQGQYDDSDMGVDLYYNRYRYYSAELGQYITQDPIGLAGGNPTLYGYVFDPNTWIDPLGLRCKKTSHQSQSRRGAFNQAKSDAGVPRSQQPVKITRPKLLDANGNKIIRNGKPVTTRQYEFRNIHGERVFIQEHSWGHTNATPGHGLEPHFNVRPWDNLGTGSFPGTHGHYNFPR